MLKTFIFFVFVATMGFVSCNKNSNQLPPVVTTPVTLIKTCTLNSVATIDVVFSQTKNSNHDTIWVSLTNLTGKDLTRVRVLVEMCGLLPQNFDNCTLQTITSVDTIKAGKTSNKMQLYSDKGLILSTDLINVGIISCDSLDHPLGGVYNSVDAEFTTKTDSLLYYTYVRGYVFADGASLFRFKAPDSVYYNAVGSFIQNLSYSGGLLKAGAILSTLTIDSLPGVSNHIFLSNDSLSFRFKLKTQLADSTQYILVNVKK